MGWLAVLNNREWAILFWLTVLIICASFNTQIRTAFRGVLKAFFVKPITVILLLLLGYVALMVFDLAQLGLWDISQLKNTILWTVTVGIATMLNINDIAKDEQYFRNTVPENFKLAVFLEFLVNVYVFSLPVELVLFPVSFFLTIMFTFAKTDAKYKAAEKLFYALLATLGIGLLGYDFYNVFSNFSGFATISNLVDFFLPIILTIPFLPFIYALVVYWKYESAFLRLPIFVKDPALRKYTRRQILVRCGLNLKMLDRFLKNVVWERPSNRQEVLALLKRSKSAPLPQTSNQLSEPA